MRIGEIILASASPRRAELLRQVGIPFTVHPSRIDETYPPTLTPSEGVAYVALEKAKSVAEALTQSNAVAVLAADTTVILDGESLGKPTDEADARDMLQRLSGRDHVVATGVALLWKTHDAEAMSLIESWTTETRVWFRHVHPDEIDAYIASGRPMDKAGAYGIQEDAAAFVTKIEGCYFNVVGLPLAYITDRLRLRG